MCDILGQKIQAGNSKKAQTKEWQQYFKFEIEGQKYLIIEVYGEPLLKEDKRRMGNNSTYVEGIELLLMNRLSFVRDHSFIATKNDIFFLLGFVNSKYKEATLPELLENISVINKFDLNINNFYMRVSDKLTKILVTALGNLKNRCILDYSEQIIIVVDASYKKCKESEFPKIATKSEIQIIEQTKNEVLDEMSLSEKVQAYRKYNREYFNSRVNKLLQKKYGWEYFYKVFNLDCKKENFTKEIPCKELNDQRLELNCKVIDVINQQAKNYFDKKAEVYDEESAKYLKSRYGLNQPLVKEPFKYPNNYVDAQCKLAEYLIRIEK